MKSLRILLLLIFFSTSLSARCQQTDAEIWEQRMKKGIEFIKIYDYDSAQYYLISCFELAKNLYTKYDLQLGVNATLLGKVYLKTNQYKKAEEMMLLDLEISENINGKSHSDYGISLYRLADIYNKMKEYEKAQLLYYQALENIEKSLGKKNRYYGICLVGLADLYNSIGEDSKAEYYQLEALKILRVAIGEDHEEYGVMLHGLASFYKGMGEYEKALPLFLHAVELAEKNNGKLSTEYGIRINGLAALYVVTGEYEKALYLLVESIEIIKKNWGIDHPHYAQRLNNMATLCTSVGEFEKALALYIEALNLIETNLGAEHSSYGVYLNNLAGLYEAMGEYNNSFQLYQEALVNLRKSLGTNHSTTGQCLNGLAGLHVLLGRYKEALPLYKEANEILVHQITEIFSFRSENEKKAFMGTILHYFEVYQSFGFVVNGKYAELTKLNLNNQLLLSGLLLNSSKGILEGLSSLENAQIEDKITNFRNSKALLAEQYSLPQSNRNLNTDSLSEHINAEEAELVVLHRENFGENVLINKDWNTIKQELEPNEVAVEFSHFAYKNNVRWTDSIIYAAYLIKKEWAEPKVVYLFEENQLKTILNKKSPNQLYAARGATVKGETASIAYADSIYNLVWKPLEEELKGVETIYYATDGLLHQIPFVALGTSETKSLGEQYTMVQLSSTAKIATKNIEGISNELLLIGGIDYTYDTTDVSSKQEIQYAYLNTEALKRSSSNQTRGENWNYLPGTKTEVEQIQAAAVQHNKKTTILSGNLATEESFKKLSGNSPNVLHIATHGFFFENPKKDKPKRAGTQSQFTQADDPLLRSGLILSGGNYTWRNGSNPYEKEDGILTALEISNMDLKNTQLVVLSACETGLGDIEGNEGVYGLQRAFKMAGVESIIMSLWQVPDAETSEFMQLFYNTWFKGVTVREAFNSTQRVMQTKYASEPYKWAAFILVR